MRSGVHHIHNPLCPSIHVRMSTSVLYPTHIFLSRLFFASICCYINFIASPSLTFIHTMSPMRVCLSLSPSPSVFAFICPYIMFTAMCPCVCLPLLYAPFAHFYDCLSVYTSLCMSIFMQIYYFTSYRWRHNVHSADGPSSRWRHIVPRKHYITVYF